MTDEEIVEIARSQNPEKYGELVNRYEKRLLRYANYLLRDEKLAEDVVQDAFIKGFTNLKGFNTNKKFSSWIYRIVHNEAVNNIKRSKRTITLEKPEFLDLLAHKKENVDEEIDNENTVSQVKENIKKLNLKYSEVLALYFLEEKSYEEISYILRIPMGTVGTRLNRGKKLLKKLCQK